MSTTVPNQRKRAGDDPDAVYRRSQAPNYGIKRMIFVASLFFQMTGVKEPTKTQMEDVNRRFDLANRDQTLLFPAAVSGMVWGKIDLAGYLRRYKEDASQVASLASELVMKAPFWVKYGTPDMIVSDVKAVIEKVATA